MSASRKILVVDDDPVVGKSFDRVLAGKGYAVITAESGEEALRKLETESYDAVFTDIKMPGISGIEVAERIKAAKPWMPVVIVTGYGSEAYRLRATAAGVTEFLQKPLSPEMIAGSAEKAVHERESFAAPASPVAAAAAESESGAVAGGNRIKNIALFFAAPFVGLAYIVAMPFVAAAMLAWFAGKALAAQAAKLPTNVKRAATIVAAPFLGLGFILALPFVGIGALGYYALKAMRKD